MRNKVLFYVILAVILLAIIGIGFLIWNQYIIKTPIQASKELPFETIEIGSYGKEKQRKDYTITNQHDWQDLWDKIYSTRSPKPSLPKIDFTQSIIIGVFLGQRNTGGYSIEITKVLETEKNIEVLVEETSPGEGCMVSMALTYPMHIIKIQKVDKEIEFKPEKIKGESCF